MKKIVKVLSLVAVLGAISVPNFKTIKEKIENNNIEIVARGVRTTKGVKFTPAYSPEDPYYKGTQKVNNKYQNISYKHIGDIERVWDNYTGEGVLIADIDTGLDINHPDFEGRISSKSGYFYTEYDNPSHWETSPFTVKRQIGTSYLAHDWDSEYREWSSHGTNTAGAAAAGSSDVGTVGIAFDADLLIIKSDLDDNSINEAIKYCVDNGAQIINMSFGAYAEKYYDGNYKEWCTDDDYYEEAATSMIEALNYAHEHGVILIAAAGNECTSTASYPACNDYVIGVGALAENSSNKAADYSNYNPKNSKEGSNVSVDISAPGTVVAPTYAGTKRNGYSSYDVIDGTSFACPIVVGAAALWLEKYPNSTPEQFEKALFDSAKDIGTSGWDTTFGYGALDVGKLMEQTIDGQEEQTIELNETNVSLKVGETFQLVASGNGLSGSVSYVSSNQQIATVSESGLITAVGVGQAQITVNSGNLSAICMVNVEKAEESEPSNPPVEPSEPEEPEEPNNDTNNKKTCGGEIGATSAILSMLSLLGFVLIRSKKNR